MTRITKPVSRESAVIEKGRPLVVTLHPRHLEVRLKGTRHAYTIGYDAALWWAIKREFEQQRRERAAQRNGRRTR